MKLTIFTPTYNRAYTLERLYRSLLKQTNMNFEWLIVDDGSIDNTKELINNWRKENRIKIRYYYQKNSGKHVAHNQGVNKAKGDLFTCLDSDDWFYENAVEEIIKQSYELDTRKHCGLLALDTYEDGSVIGDEFPENLKYASWKQLIFNHKIKGDKAIVFLTDVVKRYPFPENDDKHMPPSYQLFKLSEKYKFKLKNKPVKFVEYLEDGITYNIRSQYKKAPNNYILYRIEMLKLNSNIKFRIKNLVLLNIARIYAVKPISEISVKKPYKILLYLINPFTKIYVRLRERGS